MWTDRTDDFRSAEPIVLNPTPLICLYITTNLSVFDVSDCAKGLIVINVDFEGGNVD